MEPWWTAQTAGWVGGIGGSALGILGGTVGTIAGIYAPRGQCKWLVVGLFGAGIALGAVTLVAGVAALLLHQPYAVCYPLLLLGGISTLVLGPQLPMVLARYRQAEMRRLEAEELRRSG